MVVALSQLGAAPRAAKAGVLGQSGEGGRAHSDHRAGTPWCWEQLSFAPLACSLRV